MGLSVNYFANLEAECHFPKLGCSAFSFSKRKEYYCNLSIYLLLFVKMHFFCYNVFPKVKRREKKGRFPFL